MLAILEEANQRKQMFPYFYFRDTLKADSRGLDTLLPWYLRNASLPTIKSTCRHLPWPSYFDNLDMLKTHMPKTRIAGAIGCVNETLRVDESDPYFYILETLYHEREDMRAFIQGLDGRVIADAIPAHTYERDGGWFDVDPMPTQLLQVQVTSPGHISCRAISQA